MSISKQTNYILLGHFCSCISFSLKRVYSGLMIRLEESGPVILDSALSMGVNTGREGIVSEGKGIYLHQNTERCSSAAPFARQPHHSISSASLVFGNLKAEIWCAAPRGQNLHSQKISAQSDK